MKSKFIKILLVIFITIVSIPVKQILATEYGCGSSIYAKLKTSSDTCSCGEIKNFDSYTPTPATPGGLTDELLCCGLWEGSECVSGQEKIEEEEGKEPDPAEGGDSILELTNETFDSLNPLKIAKSTAADDLSTPGGIVSRLLNFLFPLAGLILFALISWGGFEMLIGATDQKGLEAGKNRVTAAIVGFILLFSSYWLTQIVEMIFGISIL